LSWWVQNTSRLSLLSVFPPGAHVAVTVGVGVTVTIGVTVGVGLGLGWQVLQQAGSCPVKGSTAPGEIHSWTGIPW
jgi:hypothetical protein